MIRTPSDKTRPLVLPLLGRNGNRRVSTLGSMHKSARLTRPPSLVLMPTEKPGYFSMLLSGNDEDLRSMVEDQDAIRRLLHKRIGDRQDLVFSTFDAVSCWRWVCSYVCDHVNWHSSASA